jgi:hypothetical protein
VADFGVSVLQDSISNPAVSVDILRAFNDCLLFMA